MPTSHTPQLALLCCRTLSSSLLRQHLLTSDWSRPQSERELRLQLYLSNQPWQARLPDHVFDLGFKAAQAQGLKDGQLATTALRMLAERYLEVQHGQVHVRLNLFGEWQQSVLSRVSGVPMIAALQALHLQRGGYMAADLVTQKLLGRGQLSPLPCITPRDGAVEDYISREGLNESHLHLNGSSFAEQCWLRAMARPDQEVKQFSGLWQAAQRSAASDRVRELARLHDTDFNPTQFRHDLMLARQLRGWLVHFAQQPSSNHSPLPWRADDLRGWHRPAPAPALPKEFNPLHSPLNEALAAELTWITQLLRQHALPPQVDRILHLYLLLQHQYRALMVQGEELYGFDQFQKFTHTELRSPAEKRYLQRLRDMHGPHTLRSQSNYLEGRFAPKPTATDNTQLLKIILRDYLEYLQEGNDSKVDVDETSLRSVLEALDTACESADVRWPRCQQLALVAHFIKEDWDMKKGGSYRHYNLRRKLEAQMAQLRTTLKDHPRLHRWVRGVDGAANELHAPPEVFASVFRQAARAGLGHRSFHVGEDFPHLLTGLRHMLDALELLDLREGARVGHGTALGIASELWLERMPSTLHLKRSERLLDLLAALQLLRELPDTTAQAYQVELELNRLLPQVFKAPISAHLFERAMRLRGLHMGFVASLKKNPDWRWTSASLVDSLREEARLVNDAEEQDQEALSLLWRWHNDRELWKRSESLLSIETQDALFTPTIYLRLQQALMKRVAARRIIIETLPSSNVRISQYERFEEHHALRWMGVPGHIYEGDTPIMVSLGSDDPGIFAGNLKGEFYQLYAVLRQQGLSDADALRHVSIVNERGRQYRFHDPAL
jgi:adenosine deaminase